MLELKISKNCRKAACILIESRKEEVHDFMVKSATLAAFLSIYTKNSIIGCVHPKTIYFKLLVTIFTIEFRRNESFFFRKIVSSMKKHFI